MQRATAGEPLYDFTRRGRRAAHGLARGAGATRSPRCRSSKQIPALYIADGHHRAASAARARNETARPSRRDDRRRAAFIAVAFPDDQVQILPYNRTVKDLAGRPPAQFFEMLRERFPVAPRQRDSSGQGGGRDVPRGQVVHDRPDGRRRRRRHSRAEPLDVARLQRHVLERIAQRR